MAKASFQLDGGVDRDLGDIARSQGISKPEALRRAIALMKLYHDETKKGNSLIVTDATGTKLSQVGD